MISQSEPGSPQKFGAANDQDMGSPGDLSNPDSPHLKLAVDGNYHFEICQNGPQGGVLSTARAADWLWRLLSPAGAIMIECAGYRDEESCRAAVSLLQEKAGAADVSLTH